MDKKVIKFPNKNNDEKEISKNNGENIENDIIRENMNYFESVKAKMENEYSALERTGNERVISLGTIVYNIVNSVVEEVSEVFKNNPDISSQMNAQQFVIQSMQSSMAIFAGGIISPLTGDEEEWEDITVPEDIGQELKIEYRNKEFKIPIESIQMNKRYPRIYRLNGDNKFAHRTDYIQFFDVDHPENIHATEDSIRFIQFPYTMEAIRCGCLIDEIEKVISHYIDLDYDEILNGLIYHDEASEDLHAYVIAPKIPFFMLEENGIDVEKEIAEYIKCVDSLDLFEFGNEDDDDELDFS